MRIGVLTYHCVPNFGAQLQALSTVLFLKSRGHDVTVINWYPNDLEEMYAQRVPKEQIEAHEVFTKTYLPISAICRTEEELIYQIDNLDIQAVLVGSDALLKYDPWINRIRPYITGLFSKKKRLYFERLSNNPFFGGFITKTKKTINSVAFSVSSQNCAYKRMSFFEKGEMRRLLSNYKWISVRDEWTKEMINSFLNKDDIAVTPDPVFSFNQNCQELIFSRDDIMRKYNLGKKYILLSFGKHYVTKDYLTKLGESIIAKGYLPILLPMPEGHSYTVDNFRKIDLPLDPLDWYCLIKYSQGYIGERMHPIVVCLHNGVPFFCYDEYGIRRFSIGKIRKNYVPDSSKTYQIVKRYNLLDNLYSYHIDKELPLAEEVLDKLDKFDRTNCSNYAYKIQKDYTNAMEFALKILSK